MNAKDFVLEKLNRIKELCNDIKYAENKELRIWGIQKIETLALEVEENLDYIDYRKEVQNEK